MRRSINGPRSASTAASLAIKQGSMARRAVSTDENVNLNGKGGGGDKDSNKAYDFMEDAQPRFARNGSGPMTDRLKRLERKFGQVLEIQAKFTLMDKWIQQQFGIKLFPKAVINSEKFAEGNPDDVDNPFYAIYLVIQRMKTLEDKVAKLEAHPYEDASEAPSHYSAAHAFRNIKGKGGSAGGGVKRTYGSASSPATTPKKQKVMPRPVAHSSTYPFKPSVKILPRDPNAPSPVKKQTESTDTGTAKDVSSPSKTNDQSSAMQVEIKVEPMTTDEKADKEQDSETSAATEAPTTPADADSGKEKDAAQTEDVSQPSKDTEVTENVDTTVAESEKETQVISTSPDESEVNKESTSKGNEKLDDKESSEVDDTTAKDKESTAEHDNLIHDIKVEDDDETQEPNAEDTQAPNDDEEIPTLEDSTAVMGEDMEVDSEQDDEEVELKPDITLEEDMIGEDVSGSEASVSSLTSASGRHRLSTRRQAAAAAALTASGKGTEDEKPVMYTARGRRHTVPRRYAEFTGHDNVVSILKSQQRAEKTAGAGPGRPGRKPGTSKAAQDTPPKIKKMVKVGKSPTAASSKKAQTPVDSDGDGEAGPSSAKKKAGPNTVLAEKPPCVDALVDRVMAREVDHDGMVLLSEAYPNIFVNQQQLVTVVVRSNGKATRLTRKMTTLVFEDSLLASASPFGTKYYKEKLPPEPLEAMVDFIADSGFEPHYTKKKIYMIVGQVCNEARAGRVSRKFLQPLEEGPTAGPSGSQAQDPTSSEPPSPAVPVPSPSPQ